jgi:hypothetical protein
MWKAQWTGQKIWTKLISIENSSCSYLCVCVFGNGGSPFLNVLIDCTRHFRNRKSHFWNPNSSICSYEDQKHLHKQTNKQTNKRTNKQTNQQASKKASKQTNKQTLFESRLCVWGVLKHLWAMDFSDIDVHITVFASDLAWKGRWRSNKTRLLIMRINLIDRFGLQTELVIVYQTLFKPCDNSNPN